MDNFASILDEVDAQDFGAACIGLSRMTVGGEQNRLNGFTPREAAALYVYVHAIPLLVAEIKRLQRDIQTTGAEVGAWIQPSIS